MNNEEIFDQWCPATSRWSTWAKPVLFTQSLPLTQQSPVRGEWENFDISWAPEESNDTAIIIDLPGVSSLLLALALTRLGYQPVPLFNCCASPLHEVLPTDRIREYLVHGAYDLKDVRLPAAALPAFILDSDRVDGKTIPHPGLFDNRWLTFPQDFPSGPFLREAGIRQVILVQPTDRWPESDLAQVLIRWQDDGIQVLKVDFSQPASPRPVTIPPPPKYRWFFQRALALIGFRQNSAGGFGSVIPEPSSGAG